MLDFYYLPDCDSDMEYPDESKYLGSLTLQDYKCMDNLLSFINKNGLTFDFFSDFRVSSQNTYIIFDYLSNSVIDDINIKNDEKLVYEKLIEFFRIAKMNNSGLMCFSD